MKVYSFIRPLAAGLGVVFVLNGCTVLEELGDPSPRGRQSFARRYDSSDGPFQIASQKHTATEYRKFIHNFPNSRHLPTAIERLGELLVAEGEKSALEAYVISFPEYQHKVSEALHEIRLLERVNEHMNEHPELPPDRKDLVIRRGELFYAHHYFKGFVKLEDAIGMDAEYELRIDKKFHPEFIDVELMPGVSFAMEERHHALANVRYKIMVGQAASLGKHRVNLTFGVYRKEKNGEWKRRDGSGITHEIEVVGNDYNEIDEIEVDMRAITYFAEKAAEAKQAMQRLSPPPGKDFTEHYMYTFNLAEYTVRLEKYRTFQAIAFYHLQKYSNSSDPAMAMKASQYMEQLGLRRPEKEYRPVILGP